MALSFKLHSELVVLSLSWKSGFQVCATQMSEWNGSSWINMSGQNCGFVPQRNGSPNLQFHLPKGESRACLRQVGMAVIVQF